MLRKHTFLQIVKYRKKENVKRGSANIEKEFNSRKNQYVFDVCKYGNISELKITLETSQIQISDISKCDGELPLCIDSEYDHLEIVFEVSDRLLNRANNDDGNPLYTANECGRLQTGISDDIEEAIDRQPQLHKPL